MKTIPVAMLCHVSGETFPAVARVYANDLGTARVVAETHAKLEGVQRVTFPASLRVLPPGHREFFAKHGIV